VTSEEINVSLDEGLEKQIYDFAVKVGRDIMDKNPDLHPYVQFRYNSRSPNVMEKLIKNQDATTFLTMLDYQLNDKFIIQGQIPAKVYYLVFKELKLLRK
jgi:hypothetical protein